MRTLFLLLSLLSARALIQAQPSSPVDWGAEYSYLEQFYRHLHSHPELSFQEKATGRYLAEEMRDLGFEVTENVGGYGVVCVLRNGEGPTVMVRTDTDALPVTEATGLPYASTVRVKDESGQEVGVMHACGHDMHMTVWAGTARNMSQHKDRWKGTLVMIAQPAEERGGGAKAMLEDGLYERFPVPDYALALHVSATLPAGTVGYVSGYAMANVDMLKIRVLGRGGHGAAPHTTIDPVVMAARIILDLQTLVSRELNPIEPAVLTVGSIHGGTKGNVIPDEVALELTLRSYSDEVRHALIEKIGRVCKGVALSAGVPEDRMPIVTLQDEYTPSLYNDPDLTRTIQSTFERVLGKEKVKEVSPEMIGEDFARYGKTAHRVPISMFRLGTIDPQHIAAAEKGEVPFPSLHASTYSPLPEASIKTGVTAMTEALLELMEE